ncbi:MAG TPA: hypothetical protein VFS66_14030 [Acidimicrobiia bacterium]|nr:hypothetical protein [Acidimicrobiia bacterium]
MVVALTVLHIALAAAWFGHKLLVPADIKASIRGETAPGPFLGRLQRAERVGQVTGLGTLLAGMGLAFAVDASTVGYGVWIGATLVVATIVIGAVFARPVSKRLEAAVTSGDRVAATVAGQRLNRLLGVESLLWLGALTGMVLGS